MNKNDISYSKSEIYQIVQWSTGLVSCSYIARSPQEALDLLARDIGRIQCVKYESFNDLIMAQPGFSECLATVIKDIKR